MYLIIILKKYRHIQNYKFGFKLVYLCIMSSYDIQLFFFFFMDNPLNITLNLCVLWVFLDQIDKSKKDANNQDRDQDKTNFTDLRQLGCEKKEIGL